MFENESDRTDRACESVAMGENNHRGLGTLLSRCLEAAANDVATQISQQSERRIMPLQSKMQELAAALEDIWKTQVAMNQKIEGLTAQNQLLERASQEHARLSEEHYQRHIIEPMVRLLWPVVDVIDRTLKQKREKEDAAYGLQQSVFEQLQVYLAQFFSFYDIKAVRHPPRSSFDPKVMKPVGFIPCHDKDRDGCVAKSLQAGFRRGDKSVLWFETVTLYRYQTSARDLLAEEKGDNDGTSH